MRIIVPPSLRRQMLNLVHGSHLGIVKCKQRAREVLYWPAMNSDIEETVKNCTKCADFQRKQPANPLIPTETPRLPFMMVGTDLFEFESKTYLLTVDYYSKFIEVDRLEDLGSKAAIEVLKTQFSRHGIPEVIRSDGGPQFASKEFARLCKAYGIAHKTSSPHLPSAGGEVERAVQTVKRLRKKATDKQLALLDYRITPLVGVNLSPAQLLMGRLPRNKFPSLRELLTPTAYNCQDVMQRLNHQKANQKFYHDSKSASDLPPLCPGGQVRMAPIPGSKMWNPAIVVKRHVSPRSYIVESGGREYRRNRRDLHRSTEDANTTEHCSDLAADDNTPHLNNSQSSSHPTEPCDRSSSQQHEPATTSSAETSRPDKPYTTRSGGAVCCPQRLDL